MIGTIVYQLTRNLSCDDIKKNGFTPTSLTTPRAFIPAFDVCKRGQEMPFTVANNR